MKKGLNNIIDVMRGSTQIAKVMRGTTLIWELVVAPVIDFITNYISRVTADYGTIEDETVLRAEVVAGADYDDAIAIYNPNGGHRTGKIYDVRDITGNANNLNSAPNFTAIGVEGWNGTPVYVEEPLPTELQGVLDLKVNKMSFGSGGAIRYRMEAISNRTRNFSIWVKQAATNGAANVILMGTNNEAFNTSNDQKFPLTTEWQRIDLDLTISPIGSRDSHYIGTRDAAYTAHADCIGDILVCAAQITSGAGLQTYSSQPKLDLTVTGGGGTRINKGGLVEDVGYNNLITDQQPKLFSGATNNGLITSVIDPSGGTGARSATTTTDAGWIRFNTSSSADATVARVASVWIRTEVGTYNVQIECEDKGTLVFAVDDKWQKISTSHDGSAINTNFIDLNFFDTGKTFYYWGAILEDGTTPSFYSPTAAFPKIDYSTGQAAFLIEPTRTNYMEVVLNSSGGYNVNLALNEVGITGVPNAALTITSTGNSGNKAYASYHPSPISSFSHYLYIKKDQNETRFPVIEVGNGNGSNKSRVHLNTKTGGFNITVNTNNTECFVNDRVDWWEVIIIRNELAAVNGWWTQIYPSYGSSLTSTSGSGTGSVILGYIGAFTGRVINETPIITNGAAVTRTYGYYQTPIVVPTEFSVLLDFNLVNGGWIFNLSNDANGLNDRIGLDMSNGVASMQIKKGGLTQSGSSDAGFPYVEGRNRLLINLKNNGIKVFRNGVLEVDDLGELPLGINSLMFGNLQNSISPTRTPTCGIYEFKILPYKTDQEAIDLTTI